MKRYHVFAGDRYYKPFEPIDGTWHPVTQYECVKINEETAITFYDDQTHN